MLGREKACRLRNLTGREDVKFLARELVEGRDIGLEVLRQNGLGDVGKPVREEEGGVLAEVTSIEDLHTRSVTIHN